MKAMVRVCAALCRRDGPAENSTCTRRSSFSGERNLARQMGVTRYPGNTMSDDQKDIGLDLTQWAEVERVPEGESLPVLSAKIGSSSGETEIALRLTARSALISAVR